MLNNIYLFEEEFVNFYKNGYIGLIIIYFLEEMVEIWSIVCW